MGVFDWPLQVSDLDREQLIEIKATVDTGATYTVLPAGMLEELGVEPTRQFTFELADGRHTVMDVGRAWVTIDGASEVTPVVFGADGTDPLLGAVTLQVMGLVVDSPAERLVPVDKLRY